MLRIAALPVSLAALTACPRTFGGCEPGATRCTADGSCIEMCVCDSRGGELFADCRDAPHWIVHEEACSAGEECVSDGGFGTVCIGEDLGPCTTPHPDEYCIDETNVHRCEPFVGRATINDDGTFDGRLTNDECLPGWTCNDTWESGEASCMLPGDPP